MKEIKITNPIKTDKVIFRLKCSMSNYVLGHHVAKWKYSNDERTNAIVFTQYITVFLPRLWRQYLHHNYNDYPFDDLFSEVMSHEILHRVLFRVSGVQACCGLDKLRGQRRQFRDSITVGCGLPLDRDNDKTVESHESNINQDRQIDSKEL